MRKIDFNINDDALCHHVGETTNHLLKNCYMTKFIWLSIDINCPNPNNSDLSFID